MITIRHTHQDGTLIEGSRKGDGVYDVLRGLRDNWRYFPSLRQIGLGQSRDRAADTWKIERAAKALRDAGHEVEVVIDNGTRRTFAEAEAERYERAEARADYHEEQAGKAADSAQAAYEASHRLVENIPFGQPILVGHHSERSHRRALDRSWNLMGKSVAETERSEYHADRAQAAERFQAQRESMPTTLRRIEALEAEDRKIQRRLDGTDPYMSYGKPATGEWRERLLSNQRDIHEQLTYWRGHIKAQEAAGVKVWSKDDFAKGDFVFFIASWYEVLRVNAKSVTIPAMLSSGYVVTKAGSDMGWTDTIPYHKIKDRKSAAEMAEIIAAAEAKAAEAAAS